MPPAAAADWPVVLRQARAILGEHGPLTRPQLWAELVRRGTVPAHAGNAFRAAMHSAQHRGEFPRLPPATSGPSRGTYWTEERWAAELDRMDEPSPYALRCEREARCEKLLRRFLADTRRAPLTPPVMAQLARLGCGEDVVMRVAHRLRRDGWVVFVWDARLLTLYAAGAAVAG
jgi:hypothetical protein